jgi:Rieske Fe-S protein
VVKTASQVQASAPKTSRRGFIKFLSVVGGLLSLAPFVPWGEFLTASLKGSGKYERQRVVVDDDPEMYKIAAGKAVNVNDLNTFPPNSRWVITYPSSGDPQVDARNTDTFTKFELIRLPVELGGDKKEAAAFVAISKVCVHLWCSPNYNPAEGHKQYECPCHGSVYRMPDGLAIAGPAAIQPTPTNVMPVLTLSTDDNGLLFIEPPIWDVNNNGVLGYGRFLKQ